MSATIYECNEVTVSGLNEIEASRAMYNLGKALSEGYAQGIDHIDPSLKSKFGKLADSVWKEVTGK